MNISRYSKVQLILRFEKRMILNLESNEDHVLRIVFIYTLHRGG